MNTQYKEDTINYQRKDAVTAICYWIILMALYAIAGFVGRFTMALIPGIAVAFISIVGCITIAVKKGDGLQSLGFRKEGLKASLGLGLIFGAVAVILNEGILPALLYGWKLEPTGFLLYQFFYYLICITLPEEVIFRGYIQTRLYGMIKNDLLAMAVGGVLFALMRPVSTCYRECGIRALSCSPFGSHFHLAFCI